MSRPAQSKPCNLDTSEELAGAAVEWAAPAAVSAQVQERYQSVANPSVESRAQTEAPEAVSADIGKRLSCPRLLPRSPFPPDPTAAWHPRAPFATPAPWVLEPAALHSLSRAHSSDSPAQSSTREPRG